MAAHGGAELPEAQESLYIIYAVIGRAMGVNATAANVHDAWAAWMLSQSPDHPSPRPFEDLDPEIQRKDERYAEAIRRVACARPDGEA